MWTGSAEKEHQDERHAGERLSGGTAMITRPDMGITPPAAQKNSRAELIRIADYYPRG